jgi:hypothetical protein
MSKQSAEGVRLWAKHFAPLGNAEGIPLPSFWYDFFTACLLHSERFEWARSFLNSKAWTMILKDRESKANISFSLPLSCNASNQMECSLHDIPKENSDYQ